MKLSRRMLLRGAGAAVALPLLDAMLDGNGEALADGSPLPLRFGTWFWANGVRLSKWVPTATGTGWALPAHLVPFAPVREKISVVSGLWNWVEGLDHWGGRSGMLSGSTTVGDYGTGVLPSVDQLVAQAWAGRTPLRSLELGVSAQGDGFRPAEGSSWSGPNQQLPVEFSPRALFDRLFAIPSTDPKASKRQRARRAVLDVVAEDLRRLRPTLGRSDRARVDLHTDSIADLQRKLQASGPPGSCVTAQRPPDLSPVGGKEQLEPVNQAMVELLALALACDLTRVFSVSYSSILGETLFWPVGATHGWHELTHEDSAASQERVDQVTAFTIQQLAALVVKLDSLPEGGGRLLDRCAVYATSCVAEGLSHERRDMPVLVAGLAGGALRGGVHYRSTTGERGSKVPMTLLRALGLPNASFGSEDGLVTREQSLTALLA